MSDRRAGWLLVIVSGVVAIVACLAAYGDVSRGSLDDAANAGEATTIFLVGALPGILTVITLDVIAFIVGKDAWVRVAAASVAVLTIIGLLVTGWVAAQSTDPPAAAYWAAAGYAPGAFDCAALNADTPPEMQAALDQLEHPRPVDVYFAADDSCAAMLRGMPTDQVVADYASQLESAGWAIDEQYEGWLSAERGDYVLWVNSCYPEETETVIAIFIDGDFGLSCEPPRP